MPELRKYGKSPYKVVLVHGGPGAAGEMAPVAIQLAKHWGVVEPFQTKHSIEGQVEELNCVIRKNTDYPVVLIGFSWGAWLSIIFSSLYKSLVSQLIIIGCGPFEDKYAPEIFKTRMSRLNSSDRVRLHDILKELDVRSNIDTTGALVGLGQIFTKADSFDPIAEPHDALEFDAGIYRDVWMEAGEMRKSGKLLNYIKDITCPVVAIHGDFDPHPSSAVIPTLTAGIEDFRHYLLPHCGHKPWIERKAQKVFYEILEENINF